ncbi:MAG: AAA family ATPase [Patescibacteria group bacterium]|jgi:chromosome segregation protein|nr:AAA family ATPase [Patescibacteria group bacterium]MDD5172599.1 AAA family ATPase [Patescibacteria group bacterium]
MYLKCLEIIGFKSFAHRTVLEFLSPRKNDFTITSIVGPNGSGKSNLVEAIRWALGEQSLKTLRGKKSQDIIFSGSLQKTHLNLAEVTLFFNNEDRAAPIDYKEFTITRRIFRNGESEYLINKSRVRLQDVVILLAKSNFGQKSYSIVGQGLVDQILQSSPVERKKFFDEATGIKQYQIKKDEAVRKIEKSQINLQQANIALSEITPHLRSLTRQINKLEKRQEIENQLIQLQENYYGSSWQDINQQFIVLKEKIEMKEKEHHLVDKELNNIQKESESLVYEKIGNQYEKIQEKYKQAVELKNRQLEKQSIVNAQLMFEKEKEKRWSPKIDFEVDKKIVFSDLKQLSSNQKEFLNHLENLFHGQNFEKIKKWAEKIFEKIEQCLKRFNPVENETKNENLEEKKIKELEEKKEKYQLEIKRLDEETEKFNKELSQFNEKEREKRQQLLNWQKNIQNKQSQLNELMYKINEFKIDLARLETKKDMLENEINQEMGPRSREIINAEKKQWEITKVDHLSVQIYKLKHELELIGSIDPEVTKEYPHIRERYEFLSTQTEDLKQGIKSLNKIIQELDQKIKNQFKNNFHQINQEFDRYFKIIFGGGKAKIVLQEQKTDVEVEENESYKNSLADGIDILAVPPGKKIKNVEALSGGERALTSLALICAVIAINKPPFVVLDEVDAALDQENSFRFAGILKELRKNSQFIVITHNQQTIEGADILYGVTMGHDGVSRFVSLNLGKE